MGARSTIFESKHARRNRMRAEREQAFEDERDKEREERDEEIAFQKAAYSGLSEKLDALGIDPVELRDFLKALP